MIPLEYGLLLLVTEIWFLTIQLIKINIFAYLNKIIQIIKQFNNKNNSKCADKYLIFGNCFN